MSQLTPSRSPFAAARASWEMCMVLQSASYRVFADILRLFLGIRLDVPSNQIRPPLRALAIQLPDGKVCGGDWIVTDLLVNSDLDSGQMSIMAYGLYRGESIANDCIPDDAPDRQEQVLEAMKRPTLFGPISG